MSFTDYDPQNTLGKRIRSKKSIFVPVCNRTDQASINTEFIRFEEKKGYYIWSHPDEICFVKSADHYVKSLIKYNNQLKWMTRHSTIKELLDILPDDKFIRLNRFYLLNIYYFSHINQGKKLLYLNDDFSIAIPHRISPFICHLLKSTCT